MIIELSIYGINSQNLMLSFHLENTVLTKKVMSSNTTNKDVILFGNSQQYYI